MAAKNQLVTERDNLKSKISKGKLKGRALKKAVGRMYYLNGRLKKQKAPKFPKVDKRQGILPGFLDQLNDARVEEMVRDLLFKRLQQVVNEQVDKILKIG